MKTKRFLSVAAAATLLVAIAVPAYADFPVTDRILATGQIAIAKVQQFIVKTSAGVELFKVDPDTGEVTAGRSRSFAIAVDGSFEAPSIAVENAEFTGDVEIAGSLTLGGSVISGESGGRTTNITLGGEAEDAFTVGEDGADPFLAVVSDGDGTGTITLIADVDLTGDLTATGDSDLTGALGVTGATTLAGTLTQSGGNVSASPDRTFGIVLAGNADDAFVVGEDGTDFFTVASFGDGTGYAMAPQLLIVGAELGVDHTVQINPTNHSALMFTEDDGALEVFFGAVGDVATAKSFKIQGTAGDPAFYFEQPRTADPGMSLVAIESATAHLVEFYDSTPTLRAGVSKSAVPFECYCAADTWAACGIAFSVNGEKCVLFDTGDGTTWDLQYVNSTVKGTQRTFGVVPS